MVAMQFQLLRISIPLASISKYHQISKIDQKLKADESWMCRIGFVSSLPWVHPMYPILLHPSGKLLPNQPTRPSLRPLQEFWSENPLDRTGHQSAFVFSSHLSKLKVHTKNQIWSCLSNSSSNHLGLMSENQFCRFMLFRSSSPACMA